MMEDYMKHALAALVLVGMTAPAFAEDRMVNVATDAPPSVVVDRLHRAMMQICGRDPAATELLRTQLYRDCVATLKRSPEIEPTAWSAALARM